MIRVDALIVFGFLELLGEREGKIFRLMLWIFVDDFDLFSAVFVTQKLF